MTARKMVRPGWDKYPEGGWDAWPKEAVRERTPRAVRCSILEPREVRMLWQRLGPYQVDEWLQRVVPEGRT